MSTDSARSPRTHLLRVITLLVMAMLLLSAVASVPIEGVAQGDGSSDSAAGEDTFRSFEIAFASTEPEEPDDVDVRWNLSANATDVDTVRIEITNESGEPINVYKPNDTDVPNPFNVSERTAKRQDTDIAVDNLSAVELSLKIPPGHCDRVEGVEVSVYDGNETVGEPDIRRTVNCTASPTDGFDVTIEDYDENLTAGETGTVTATVENTAATEESQDVRFAVDGTEIERTNLTLGANESEALNFSYETTESDVGDLEIAVESEDDRATRTVTVSDPPTFAVRIVESDGTVRAGEHVNVTAHVENTAATGETQVVRFLVNGTTIERTNLTLPPNESETLNFSYETNDTDVGDLEIAVESEDDVATRTVSVEEPAFFAVTIERAPARVAAGEPVSVTALIENTGDYRGNQTVTLSDFDDAVVASQTDLSLAPGESRNVTLKWSTETSDVGNGTISVGSENQTATTELEVTEPTVESITATLAATEIRETDETTLTVDATYTDGSTRTVTDDAALSVNDTSVATVTDGGTVTAQSAGTVVIEATYRNETDTASLTVESVDDSSESDSSDDSQSSDDSDDGGDTGDTGGDAGDSGGDADDTDDADDDVGSGDGEDTDDSPGDDPTDEGPASDEGASDTAGTESTTTRSDSEATERTVIAFFPVLGLAVLPVLVLRSREWWFD